MRLAEPTLIGEARPFEELIAEVAAVSVNHRLLDALPALLLRNRFEPAELVSNAESRGSLKRLGWLADVAAKVSERLPPTYSQPDARRKLEAVRTAAERQLEVTKKGEIDYLGQVTSASSRAGKERVWHASPPLTRRWKIACDITLEQFVERARALLEGV